MNPKKINLVGKRFGKLVVKEEDTVGKRGNWCWKCICDCGNETIKNGSDLRSGNTTTCGNCVTYRVEGECIIGTIHNKHIFIIDIDDWDKVKGRKWHLGNGYIVSSLHPTSTKKRPDIKLHRLITDAPDNVLVDHINGCKLDNRKVNLRLVSHKQNIWNSGLRSTNTTGYKGVWYQKHGNKYVAEITVDRKKHLLGSFERIEDAASAYNAAALKYFGEYARLNKLPDVKKVVSM